MTKEEFLNEIEKLPKTTVNISAYNSISIDDLTKAIERFKKIPNFNELLKENKQLKTTLNEIREHISKEIKENEDLIEILEGTVSFRIGNAQSKIKILKEILEIIERGNKE